MGALKKITTAPKCFRELEPTCSIHRVGARRTLSPRSEAVDAERYEACY